jgi:hypothetical protein
MRADLGRLINFIERDRIEPEEVMRYAQRWRDSADGDAVVIDIPREDRARVSLGIAERAGLCVLEPAPGGRVQVTFDATANGARVPAVCKIARDRGWRAYRAVEAFVSPDAACRRRALLDHFGDARPGAPMGRCCDVCDPGTLGLPDPESLTPTRARPKAQATTPTSPADEPLLTALKAWRTRASDGKPAYTVAHNSTLESIAALKPATVGDLAAIKGVGPTFVERHGEHVLALVADQGVDVVAGE